MNRAIRYARKYKNILLLSFLFSIIKIPGITWGFPATLHNDESNVIRSSLGMRFGDLNPHHFDWPSLYFYINYVLFWTFIKIRTQLQLLFGVENMRNTFPFWWGPDLPFYLIGRFFVLTLSSINILLIYALANKVFRNRKIAIVAAAIYALGYWTNYISFYALPDTALIFFMLLSLYFSINILNSDKTKNYIISAFFSGMATSIKYHGFLACIVLVSAHIIKRRRIKAIIDKQIIVSALISILVFFIGTPYALIAWKTFARTDSADGAMWQISHIGRGTNWTYYLFESIPQNFGWPFALAGYAGIILLLLSKRNAYKLLAIYFFINLIFIGSWGITRAHYSLTIFPAIAIGASYAIFTLYDRIMTLKYKRKNTIMILIFIILFISPITKTIEEHIRRYRLDTRIVAGNWINKNIPEGSTIFTDKYRTAYFGGDLPVFDYNRYNMVTPKEVLENVKLPNENFYYIFVSKEGYVKKAYKEYNLIHYQDDYLRTGPKISILYKHD